MIGHSCDNSIRTSYSTSRDSILLYDNNGKSYSEKSAERLSLLLALT